MTLFIALNEIREKQDPSLQFDFVCRAGICGSCAMVINGRPTLACRTLTKNLGPEITLAPLPFFELIGDLSVDTGKWMRGMSERLQGWLHMKDPNPDLRRIEERMDPDLADRIYELDRCIECGCCVAACGTARMRKDFVGAVGLNRVARFRLDPRDTRTDDDYYERDRRRRRRLRLHVAPRLPRRLSEEPAARDPDRVHAPQDGERRLEVGAPAGSSPPRGDGFADGANIEDRFRRSRRTRGATTMRLAKFVKFREEKFGGVLFETRSEKVFTLNPTGAAVVREIAAGGDEDAIAARLTDRFADQRRGDRARGPRLHRRAARTRAPRGLTAWPISHGYGRRDVPAVGPPGARRVGGPRRAALRRLADHERVQPRLPALHRGERAGQGVRRRARPRRRCSPSSTS